MRRRQLRKDMDAFADVYNEAWAKNWGFVPDLDEGPDVYAKNLKQVFDENWFMHRRAGPARSSAWRSPCRTSTR